MKEHPIIMALYERRKELCLSRDKVCPIIGMARTSLWKRETSGRFGALEQLDRWAALLGYKLVLAPKDNERNETKASQIAPQSPEITT